MSILPVFGCPDKVLSVFSLMEGRVFPTKGDPRVPTPLHTSPAPTRARRLPEGFLQKPTPERPPPPLRDWMRVKPPPEATLPKPTPESMGIVPRFVVSLFK